MSCRLSSFVFSLDDWGAGLPFGPREKALITAHPSIHPSRQDKAMLQCELRVRWKVASDLRFRAAISETKTPSFCGISGDLAPSTRKSLAIANVRFWYAKAAIFFLRKMLWNVLELFEPLFCGPDKIPPTKFPQDIPAKNHRPLNGPFY